MQDKLNLKVKENFLTELQLEKLKKLLEQFGVEVVYSRAKDGYDLNLLWDSSEVYRKSSRYAGRNKKGTDIDWTQVDYLSSLGMTNDEISDRLGVNIRTFYRRKSDHKKEN
ncbi:MAG: hypothetical protein Q4E54_02215 [Lachnospiraceae bacterium]|nr:hypothetical protein [Lachnospiraceae bacterium]